MNILLFSAETEQGIVWLLCIVWLIISIAVIVKFFKMSEDLHRVSFTLADILATLRRMEDARSKEDTD